MTNHKIASRFSLLEGVRLWQKPLSAMDTTAQSICLQKNYWIFKDVNSHLFKFFFLVADLVVLLVMSVLSEMLGSEVLFF